MIWLVLVVGGVLALLAFVRLAPNDAVGQHRPVRGDGDKDGVGYSLKVVSGGDGVLQRIDAVMQALPRTSVLAGTVAEGRITYVTRSRWIGFPDFTTVEETGGQVRLFGRLRFGSTDFGVNKRRISKVLQSAGVSR